MHDIAAQLERIAAQRERIDVQRVRIDAQREVMARPVRRRLENAGRPPIVARAVAMEEEVELHEEEWEVEWDVDIRNNDGQQ
jgi:hypothetical protein